jgi:hypothetical protein
MPRVVKSKSAPDGPLSIGLGMYSFKLGGEDGDHYESNDPILLGLAADHPHLEVEGDDGESPAKLARAEMLEERSAAKERSKAEKARAEKDPAEPAPTLENEEGKEEVPTADSQAEL